MIILSVTGVLSTYDRSKMNDLFLYLAYLGDYFEGKKKISLTATTNYKVLDSNNNYSLLNLAPLTGRKHQIRRQLLMLGHPVLGDSKYRLTYD